MKNLCFILSIFINKLGQKKSIIIFLIFFCLSMLLFGIANKGWMMFVVIVIYALGGMASPILQALISSKVPDNKQGLLQGGLTSILSLTSVFGPLLMTWIFAYFTSPQAPIVFSGAPFILGAILAVNGSFCIYGALRKSR